MGMVAHKRHAQEHRVENWSYSAAPFRAAGADQAKMAWLAAGSQAFTVLLPLLGRLLLSCCVSCCAGPPQASGCCSSTNAPGRPESSAGASDKASFVLQLVQLVRCCSQRCLIRAHYHITQLGEPTLVKLTQTTRGPSDLQMSLE